MPGLGQLSYMQIGKESTFGTGVPATQRLELISSNVQPVIGTIPDPSLYSGVSPRGLFQGGLYFRGTFVVRMNYDGLMELCRGVFGSYSSSTVGTGVLDHLFKEGATLPSYTMEVCEGGVGTSVTNVFKLTGAKFINVTFRVTAGQGVDAMVQAEFTVLAKDKVSDQSPTAQVTVSAISSLTISGSTLTRGSGSFVTDGVVVGMTIISASVPVGTTVFSVSALSITMSAPGTNGSGVSASFKSLDYPSVLPVLFHQASTVDDGITTSGSRVRALEVTLEQPHVEDRFYLGSLNPDEALRNDFLVATLKVTQEFATKAQFDAARAFTQGSPQFKFVHTSALTGGFFREFELRANSANITDFSAPVEGYGILISTVTWRAFQDPTDLSAVVARIRNGQTALA